MRSRDHYPYYSPPSSPQVPSPARSRSSSIRSTDSLAPSLSPSFSTLNLSENQTTLTLLPTTLSLVNIPRQRAVQGEVCNRILCNLLSSVESAEFLAIVANELELSIYADAETIRRTKLIKMAKKEHRMAKDPKQARKPGWKPMEFSSRRWSVLQVDTHDDQDAGTRIHQISSCLTKAAIPILFVSSHSADFILVKSSRLAEVIQRLGKEGFGMYDEHGISPYLAPVGGTTAWLARHEAGEDVVIAPLSLEEQFDMHTTELDESKPAGLLQSLASPAPSGDSTMTLRGPQYFVTPLSGPVACIGLAEEFASQWLLKIVRVVAFAHQILLPDSDHPSRKRRRSSGPERRAVEGMHGIDSPLAEDAPSEASGRSTSSSSSPEGEWSDSYEMSDEYDSDGSSSSVSSRASRDSNLSIPSPSASSSMSSIQHPPLLLPLTPPSGSDSPLRAQISATPATPSASRQRSVSAPPSIHPAILALPFFSFIRTRGATSLTASTKVLRKLFPVQDRYMVMSAGELDGADDGSDEGEEDVEEEEEEEEGSSLSDGLEVLRGPLRCLQVDLSAFAIDKVGLANRISEALLGAHINHLYTSTLKTANVFVSDVNFHAARAALVEAAA